MAFDPQNPQVRAGAPPGTRTPNPRIRSGMLGVSGRSACTDSTRKRSGSTQYTGIWPVLVPRPVPRPHGQHTRMHHGQSPIRRPQGVVGSGTAAGGRHGDQPRERPARMRSGCDLLEPGSRLRVVNGSPARSPTVTYRAWPYTRYPPFWTPAWSSAWPRESRQKDRSVCSTRCTSSCCR